MVIEITDSTFDQLLESDQPVLVDFWASWCGPCKALAPTIDKLAETFDGKIKFAKINVDENGLQADKYGVRSIPTLLVFVNGSVVERVVGHVSQTTIEETLNSVV